MKKIILLAGLLFCSLIQAQGILIKGNGETITEGKVFTFNTTAAGQTDVDFVVTNQTNAPVYIKLMMNEIENNSTGVNVQFCFGQLCYSTVTEDSTVPTNDMLDETVIQPQGTNAGGEHFFSVHPGDNPSQPVTYNMSFIQVDANGTLLNTLVTFNYVYQPTAAIGDYASLKNIGITVNNTVIKDNLSITTTQKTKMEVYNITGQIVKTAAIQTGIQAINMADLSAAPYIVRFTNDKNQTSQIKVVKQ